MSWKARRYMSRHHILPKFRGGPTTPENIIILVREKHDAWHRLFGHLTFREAANLLLRAQEAIEKRGEL